MKHLSIILIITFSNFYLSAQTITLTSLKRPCNKDGEIQINFNNFALPVFASYFYNGKNVLDTVTVSPVIITDFEGGTFYANVAENGTSINAFETFPYPFNPIFSIVQGICPQKGNVTTTITGGTPPYNYTWFDADDNQVVGQSNPISLDEGPYYVDIVDAAGCVYNTNNDRKDSTFIYMNPDPGFTYNIETTIANCTDGSAKVVNIVGGLAPFSYEWSDGTNANEIVGRSSGSYTVHVIDANGCKSWTQEVFIQQTKQIKVDFVNTPETCSNADGKLQAFPSGGKTPYQYQWSGFPSNTTNTLTSIPSNYYNVSVTDADGCVGFGNIYFQSISPVYAQISAYTPANCNANDGSATIKPLGGTAPYAIKWQHNGATSFTINDFSEGNYNFLITDANNCKRTGTVNISSTPMIYAYISVSNPTCDKANGTVSTSISGGTSPYSYKWSNGATTQNVDFLTKGYYAVTITDATGCSVVKGINLYAYSPLALNFSTTNATCIFNKDGAISANIVNGTAPYTYTWSNNQNTSTITNLATGKYYLTVKDADGCIGNDLVFVDYNVTNNSCYCTVTGKVYHDLDNDCLLDNNESGIQNIQLGISPFGYSYTDVNGIYQFKVPQGNFRLEESIRNQYPISSCNSSFFNFVSTPAAGCQINHNISHAINPLHDISIKLWNKDRPVAGYEYNQQLTITNMGTIAEPGIIGIHQSDVKLPTLNVLSGSLTADGVNRYTTPNLISLAPGQSQVMDLNYPVSATIPLGTELIFYDSCAYKLPIENWLNDYSPADNVLIKRDIVVGSYDPNFIEVLPQGNGAQGFIEPSTKDMSYMVHFQNEGTWYAKNVEVIVDIDSNIDIKSIIPSYNSHLPSSITINTENQLVYVFKNIDLYAKAWNEALSQGMFSFQCKLKNGLSEGTKISNQANIFFDFNPPVVTNTTINTIDQSSSVEDKPIVATLTIAPNPASDHIHIFLPNSELQPSPVFSIFDAAGKLITTQTDLDIDISTFEKGLYIVKCKNENQSYVGKFIKT